MPTADHGLVPAAHQPAQRGHQEHSQSQAMVCPDPSKHERTDKERRLQDSAAGAALYVTHPERGSARHNMDILDADGKLSAAGNKHTRAFQK